ncbi:MAG: hypothetical protein KA928_08535 [Longilinea sp.]|nr:hypothetical protein [Longilinea sp.]
MDSGLLGKMITLSSVSWFFLVILLVEVSIYTIFAVLVFSKTSGAVCRRWKASIFSAILLGVLCQAGINGLLLIGLLTKLRLATFIQDLSGYVHLLIPGSWAMLSLITMPTIILATFGIYYDFVKTDDYLIEKYWQNPKIHYGRGQKPPLLKP